MPRAERDLAALYQHINAAHSGDRRQVVQKLKGSRSQLGTEPEPVPHDA